MSEPTTQPTPEAKPAAPPARAEGFWQPFAALRSEMDRAFDNIWRGFGGGAAGLAAPAIDIVEADGAYRLTAELPGMDAKDVELSISGDMLTIKGEKKEEREEKTEAFHLSERRYGAFQRAVALPRDVDRAKIGAAFDKGVLTVTLPKAPEAAPARTRIDIRPGA